MYLLGWFVVGFVLATGVLTMAMAVALLWSEARSTEAKPSSPGASGWGTLVVLAAALVLLCAIFAALLWFAAASDQAGLSATLLWLRSPFLGARFQYMLWGAAFGVFTLVFRRQIATVARQTFEATIGGKESTAWALQSVLALLIVLAVAFAIKPDLVAYLRSLEYGGFKATFAEHSTSARAADLNYKELLWGFTLSQYEEFEKSFIGKDSDRAVFGDRYFPTGVQDQRKRIASVLYSNYLAPVIKALICLEKNHSTSAAAADPNLIKLAALWTRFLLELKSDPSGMKAVDSFLKSARELAKASTEHIGTIVPRCKVPVDESVATATHAKTVEAEFDTALAELKKREKTAPEYVLLTAIEPYLFSVVGDLIVVLQGQRDKAEFLVRVLNDYPRNGEVLTPGIVNIFYQLADAQLKSFESWPAEAILENVNYAIRGADALIAKASEPAPNDAPAKANKPAGNQVVFFGIVNRNLMILHTQKLALFNQRVLGGEILSQSAREDWLRTYSRVIVNLTARSEAPIVAYENLPPAAINDQSRKAWPSITIESEYLADLDLTTVISSLLLDRAQGLTTSALACNTAQFYLSHARRNIDRFVERKTDEEKKANKEAKKDAKKAAEPSAEGPGRAAITKLQLKRIVDVISNWAGGACNWKRDPA